MMVGDNLKDDVSSALFLSPSFAPYLLRTFLIHFEVACGKRAGAFTCLLDKTGRNSLHRPNSPELDHPPNSFPGILI
ncbi:uncharacterized protein LOC114321863 isoform X3 [Camellia sinensis]|uniref:uncharacterized protein LOC114321863 isoform X3 n=1 Tax=Camellia sinensis TaxID=4442 RepID=UPI0010363103|nr:uncharacterized protein LOC114321863 isoform X3 [Camellia sinensis]